MTSGPPLTLTKTGGGRDNTVGFYLPVLISGSIVLNQFPQTLVLTQGLTGPACTLKKTLQKREIKQKLVIDWIMKSATHHLLPHHGPRNSTTEEKRERKIKQKTSGLWPQWPNNLKQQNSFKI
jgi:hypothetical protein